MTNKASPIEHVVVIMLENRSFDSMLGFLYDEDNPPLRGQTFDGLTGNEFNLNGRGNKIQVTKIQADDEYAYYMPKGDPGEGFNNTNVQLFGAANPPYSNLESNMGFVKDFENPVDNSLYINDEEAMQAVVINKNNQPHQKNHDDNKEDPFVFWQPPCPKVPDMLPDAADIMRMYTPETLPVLSTLAKSYAVSDSWFCSAPTETLPNRAFTHMGTSLGNLYDEIKSYPAKSIFKHLQDNGNTWGIFGNEGNPYTVPFCQDIPSRQDLNPGCDYGSFELFQDYLNDPKKTLPDYCFLEPVWGSRGNSQHPNYNVAAGEQYLLDIYRTLKESDYWGKTLLVITYDEHGGCYDHVTPPFNAVSPPAYSRAFDFGFTRFGLRVPAVFVSPWIEAGTIYRAEGATPHDHTSILATLESLFGLEALTERDKAAPDVLDVINLDTIRTDNPMEHVVAPAIEGLDKIKPHASQIQFMHAGALAEKQARETGMFESFPAFKTSEEADEYIRHMHEKYYA